MTTHLRKYADDGFHKIEGWVDPNIFKFMKFLAELEINQSLDGVAEIGVHHGKFFILLRSLLKTNSRSVALDVFDHQELNIDASGNGSLTRFKHNLSLYDPWQGESVQIIEGDSTFLRIPPTGFFRFISIDGGHSREHAASDLRLAEKLLADNGVVVVDDFARADWIGVTEGVLAYLDSGGTLIPFAAGYNKLFMARLSYVYQYYESVANSTFSIKTQRFHRYWYDIVK
jgi:hypothetical protein